MNVWDQAARQAERELGPQADKNRLEERALEIQAELETVKAEAVIETMSPLMTGPQGNQVIDWPKAGRQLMKAHGVDPDKPLDINWQAVPDRRANGDAAIIGNAILAERNGHG